MDLRRGDPDMVVSGKQAIYFAVGKALEPVIMMAGGYDPNLLFDDKIEVRVPISKDIVITGHPDSEVDNWVIECKTMRSFAYKKLIDTDMDTQYPQYLIQGAVYCQGRMANGVIFLCLDKDASTIYKVSYDRNALKPYWEKAVANAKLIAKWVDKTRLPGRPDGLPYWYCLEGYCPYLECRFHHSNAQNKAWRERKNG